MLMTVIVFTCVKIQLPSGMSNHTDCSSSVSVYMCNNSGGIKCSSSGRVVGDTCSMARDDCPHHFSARVAGN